MAGLLLRWRVQEPRITLRWRGPARTLEMIARDPQTPLAGFVVPSATFPDPGDLAAIFASA